MKKISIFLLFLYLGLIMFMPKNYLWYGILKRIEPLSLYLQTQQSIDSFLTLKLEKNKLFKRNRRIADIDKITFLPLILYNRLEAEDIMYENMDIAKVWCDHLLVNPFECKIGAEGSFGTLSGTIYLKERKIVVDIIAENKFAKRISRLKSITKSEKGYHYESLY